jgi:hypothetical protein
MAQNKGKQMWRAIFAVLAGTLLMATGARAEQTVWRFDDTTQVGGFKAEAEGRPRIVSSPVGKALQFDGEHDSLFVDGRPLIGAAKFTIEAVFRPDGGPFQQRFMHIAETDPATGRDALPTGTGDPNGRFMFEIRVVDGSWYLDTYVKSKAGNQPLIFKDKMFPLGHWYAVAQTYDGKTYRSYVDGVLQGEAEVAFSPHGPGHVRVGARMNHRDYFTGAIAEARFTDRALSPDELLKVTK